MRILIKGGRVIDPETDFDAERDVLIEEGKISKIGKKIDVKPEDKTVIVNAKGLVVCPGLIDIHCHLREPGYEYKETIKTGTLAAVKGGFTSLVSMANTDPVNDNKSVTEYIIRKAKEEGYARVFPCGAVTKGLKGEELSEIGEMVKAGIVAVSDDGYPIRNSAVLRRALEYIKIFSIPLLSHCEDPDLSTGCVNEGYFSLLTGLEASPPIAEELMVIRDIKIAGYVNSRIHITHVSTEGSINVIREEKKKFDKLTCDTCPHYFTLTDESILTFDANYKVNPPLRSKKDVESIKEALKEGVIDIISTDHAPHETGSKEVEFALASSGISGLETAFAVSLSLFHEGVLDLKEIIKKMTVNPARLINVPYGTLGEGKIADVIVFDPYLEWIVNKEEFASKGKNTPFHGMRLKGKNLLTMVGGRIVYKDPDFEVEED
ncbi:MAG: dihydroorotase [Desulfobacterota bacterium]|nr:dihydroorotase [Thermodesulfobacteriota bacterium]MCX7858412.1 dihydroorotase [Deltaproteobacteria bacterium]MDW8002309.1 dihydroorotase [Deltaproteobacteria bacterium]